MKSLFPVILAEHLTVLVSGLLVGQPVATPLVMLCQQLVAEAAAAGSFEPAFIYLEENDERIMTAIVLPRQLISPEMLQKNENENEDECPAPERVNLN